MRTFTATPATINHKWYVVDATDKVLGRLATEVASRLRGKHKAEYTPHMDTGDYIVIINAEKIRVTGNKAQNKMYYRYSGYIGGLKQMNFENLLAKAPEQIIERAVKGMLPKGPLGRDMYRKLKVFSGPQHDHIAQQPIPLEI
ncbi:MAG: 50S ribosomal protein L13 [Gammaproteobacteria bacterium]|jgi:large subunit ribosomal protein L13|nr:50S ribosomal protein L13 [Pseudomonadota bacterium]MDG2302363.1 50S ribosomal protein L13 [Gammaproteobacteria bacterium]MBT5065119.1 50S ribosomal protein L13 [Pseudomonadota bacterium]MBT6193593.1 50S ribosomal protein L13 [Pseudomonadota bacterium]MBT6465755.1 50S ribosomal protein L13 [Pseudomonadota bacterium]